MIESIRKCPKPVIAAINGPAAGAGASLALACDFKIISSNAYLLQAFINIGLGPDCGGSFHLVRKLGYNKALELFLSGEAVRAEECLKLGLVNKVVSPDDLISECLALAKRISTKPATAVALTKAVCQYAEAHSFEETIEYEAILQQYNAAAGDVIEGSKAFEEKRKPDYTNTTIVHLPGGLVTLASKL
eukprot:CAMPEP_0174262978 /NCGR_PEP_ID=MMETSP0439-20130205/16545_1 /TAXON_ID=0 /ORGANISM="Stereomyxa ramosa, Strain Chinc5" /LENGTH=188 /DNA_ID=CAMNT_0015348059 /DNA_START=357 /DNA_END=923 /DNA_ORIENTATION=+